MNFSLRRLQLTVVFATFFASVTPALAQTSYPNRPITLVVPFVPGASTDNVARLLAVSLSETLRQQVVVENKGGGGSSIGTEFVARAPSDGYTLLFNTSSMVTNYATSPKTSRYDPIASFAPVSSIAIFPYFFVASAEVPVANIKEFVAYGRKNPGKLAYGSPGAGSATQLAMALFLKATGIDAVHVPYRGSSQAFMDLLAGRVQIFAGSASTLGDYLRDKRLKLLGFAAANRLPTVMDVPTVSETVVPNFEAGVWQGVVAPVHTPPAIIAKLNSAIQIFLKDPHTIARLAAEGGLPLGGTPEEYAAYLKKELETWSEVVRDADIKRGDR